MRIEIPVYSLPLGKCCRCAVAISGSGHRMTICHGDHIAYWDWESQYTHAHGACYYHVVLWEKTT